MPEEDRYTERLQAGLCTACGRSPAGDGIAKCETCAAVSAADGATLREQRRQRGLCPDCGKRAPAPERKSCTPCLDRFATYAARRSAAEKGLKRLCAPIALTSVYNGCTYGA